MVIDEKMKELGVEIGSWLYICLIAIEFMIIKVYPWGVCRPAFGLALPSLGKSWINLFGCLGYRCLVWSEGCSLDRLAVLWGYMKLRAQPLPSLTLNAYRRLQFLTSLPSPIGCLWTYPLRMIFKRSNPFSPWQLGLLLTFSSIPQGSAAFVHALSFTVQLGSAFHLTLVGIHWRLIAFLGIF